VVHWRGCVDAGVRIHLLSQVIGHSIGPSGFVLLVPVTVPRHKFFKSSIEPSSQVARDELPIDTVRISSKI
jgi:hypothetical protein